MSKNTSLFWIDLVLFVALTATIFTGVTGIFTYSNGHIFLGLSLCAVALLHLGLHWKWIKNAWQRYDRLPKMTRNNVWLNMGLFFTYILCGSLGLSARAIPFPFQQHIFLGVIHVCLAVLILVLQIIHISRHWKWITTMARKTTDLSASNIKRRPYQLSGGNE